MDLIDKRMDEREIAIEKLPLDEAAKDIEYDTMYASVGKEIDPEFTYNTAEKLLNFLIDKRMRYFKNSVGKISLCNQYIGDYLHLEHGDVVQVGGEGYRNENLMFWSEERGLLYPDVEVNDYGTIPSDFRVGEEEDEFPPWHWCHTIEGYDGFIWPSNILRDQIYSSLAEVPIVSLPKKLPIDFGKIANIFYTEVMLHDELIQVFSLIPRPKYFRTIAKTVIEGYE